MEYNNKNFIGSSLESVDKITPTDYPPRNNPTDFFPSLGNLNNSLAYQAQFDNSINQFDSSLTALRLRPRIN